jgi:hypothetical protein
MDKKGRWKGAREEREGFTREASKAFNVKVEEPYYCNSDYRLELYQKREVTSTRWLVIAQLKPEKPSLPEFCFRWDEKADQLDVDMKPEHKDWGGEKNGYEGHHPKKVSPGRRFDVSIKIPGIDVFHGIISFSLFIKVGIKSRMSITGRLGYKEIPKLI